MATYALPLQEGLQQVSDKLKLFTNSEQKNTGQQYSKPEFNFGKSVNAPSQLRCDALLQQSYCDLG